jgi:hypothetical protein
MGIRLLAPVEEDLSLDELLARLSRSSVEEPFAASRVDCCVNLSRALFADSEARRYPELQALGFWLRKAELMALQTDFAALVRPDVVRSARGTVFHIPPGNVDTIFIYSWTLALLTGNCNVVRISTRNSPQTLTICRLLRSVLAGRDSGQFFVQYGHDAEVTAALSGCCDVRVIWGGDETVKSIRKFALPVHAKELAFPDRYSLSAIAAAKWLEAAPEDQDKLLHQFYNDTFWFDQMACSSPRILVWCGEPGECRAAAAGWTAGLQREVEKRGYRIDPAVRMQKLLFSARAILDQPVTAYLTPGPQFTVLELASMEKLRRDHCGGGLLFQFQTAALEDLAPHITRQDQTLTWFGFEREEIDRLLRRLRGRGLDRVAPIGQALNFSRFWDGYDLLQEMTRCIAVKS